MNREDLRFDSRHAHQHTNYMSSDNPIRIIANPITRAELRIVATERFGDMVKAVVDLEKNVMAIGAEMHADEEACLLEQGSRQENLWGINLYVDQPSEHLVEFDSMINIRPRQGNRSRSVEDLSIQEQIRQLVVSLIH